MGLTKPRAAQIFNLDYKQSTRVVTATNITLSGGAPSLVDGVTLSLGDRVLVTGQTTGTQNGLYYVTTLGSGANGTWARTSDGNENGEIEAGMIVMVTEGVIYADTQWKLITDDPIVINTTALTFTQNYMANSISSGSSNVVVNSNANVTISSAGTANVLTVSNTGTFVSGLLSVTGNITSGNVSATSITGTLATASQTNITGVGNITAGTWSANAVGIAHGGTGATTAAEAFADLTALTLTTASATPLVLTNTSTYQQQIIGSTTQTITLPSTATLAVGWSFLITNGTGFTVTVQTSTGATVYTNANIGSYRVWVISTANNNAASWSVGVDLFSFETGTGSVVRALSPVLTTPNIGAAIGTSISVTGNINSGNLRTVGQVSATGNVTANYILGNGALLTGVITSVANINNGTSNVTVVSSGGNVTVGVGGTGNVAVFSTSGLDVTGRVSATGNITGSNILGNGFGLTGINTFSNVTVTGGNSAVADGIADTLTLTAGTGISIVVDPATDTITIGAQAGSEVFVDGADFGTVTEPVTLSDDLGLVTDAVDSEADLGTLVTSGLIYPDQFVLPSYTTSTLPSAAVAGAMIYVTNETGGPVPAFADGTNWRRVTDRAIVT
jgi:hypothetical protein